MSAAQQIEQEARDFFAMLPAETVADELRHLTRMANASPEMKLHDKKHISDLNFTQHQTGQFILKLAKLIEKGQKNTVNLSETSLN